MLPILEGDLKSPQRFRKKLQNHIHFLKGFISQNHGIIFEEEEIRRFAALNL